MQLLQRLRHVFVVVNQDGFRNLEFEPGWRQPGFFHGRGDLRRQPVGFELDDGEVDRDLDVGRPRPCVGASPFKDPGADGFDQARRLGRWDKYCWRNCALLRVSPSQERLATGDRVGFEIYRRLIVEPQLAAGECEPQVLFQIHSDCHRRSRACIVEDSIVSALSMVSWTPYPCLPADRHRTGIIGRMLNLHLTLRAAMTERPASSRFAC